jgi:cobalt-zinc-cadmium efflux system outer membrane protein
MMQRTLLIILTVCSVPAWGQQKLTVAQALKMARVQNPALKVLEQDIYATEADEATAQVRPNPIFNIQLLHIARARDRADGTSWTNGANTQYWYQLTKPIQIAGQRQNKIDLADKLTVQSKADFKESLRNVYASVASSWIDVWSAQVNLNILLTGKQYIDSLVHVNQYRLKDKVITETELARTQLLQEQYARDITAARETLYNELQQLRFYIGSRDSLQVVEDDPVFSRLTLSGDSLIQLGTHQRTDVLSAKTAIDVSLSNIKLQRSLAYPRPEVGGMWNPQNTVPYFGLYGTIGIPLFDRNQGNRQKAEVLRTQAEQNLVALQHQAETEIITAYRSYQTQRKTLADYRINLDKAEHILGNVRYSYLKGATTVIDFLEAQRSWLDTQQRYYSTMESFRRSYVNLLFATGSINQLAE